MSRAPARSASPVSTTSRDPLFETHDWADVGHMGSSEYLAEGFLKLLQGGESPINANVCDGYISAMMCLAADRSIETGQTVKLNLDTLGGNLSA